MFTTQLQQCEQVCSNSSTAAVSKTRLCPAQLLMLALSFQAICCLVLTVQVPVSFSPAKHRSTLIDSEVLPGASHNKVLQGTSDTPAALSTLPGRLAAPSKQRPAATTAARGSAKQPKRRVVPTAGKAGAAADAAEDKGAADAVSCTIYQSEFAATAAASTQMLTHSPTRVAAARRILESSSEWAEINKLQGIQAQQQVGVASACPCVVMCVPCSPVLFCRAAGLAHTTYICGLVYCPYGPCLPHFPAASRSLVHCPFPLPAGSSKAAGAATAPAAALAATGPAGVPAWGAGMPSVALYHHRQPGQATVTLKTVVTFRH